MEINSKILSSTTIGHLIPLGQADPAKVADRCFMPARHLPYEVKERLLRSPSLDGTVGQTIRGCVRYHLNGSRLASLKNIPPNFRKTAWISRLLV